MPIVDLPILRSEPSAADPLAPFPISRARCDARPLPMTMDEARLRWMLILHMAFVGSGLLFAVMDYIGNRAEKPREEH